MPEELSADKQSTPILAISPAHRLAMIVLAYVPCCLSAAVLGQILLGIAGLGPRWLLGLGVATLYLLPPLAVLPLRLKYKLTDTRIPIESKAFLAWWYAAQWQVIFNRLPILEETLRLVPGLYSTWLRLWGARVGKLVYWSPGMRISDRPFLEIGDRTVVGLDTKLYAHYLAKSDAGSTELHLAPIRIGSDALIGGCSLLTAGVQVAACEQTPAARPLAPFSHFSAGRSQRTTRSHKENVHELATG